jgi:glycerophosphoryl diester phosphodiesterase
MMRQVEVIGHRGARGLFPENTIEGFQQALDLGVNSFELDVGMTADGVVVVSHDVALNPAITRDAAGEWLTTRPLIHHLTMDALRCYDVGRIRPTSRYRILRRAQKGRDGARIPTLHEVLRRFTGANFTIELKTDPRNPGWTADPVTLADAVLAVVDAVGAAGRIVLESFDWRGPLHIRRTRPEIKLAWLTRPGTVRDAALWWGGVIPFGSVPETVAAQHGHTVLGGRTCQGGQTRQLQGTQLQGTWSPAFETLTRTAVAKALDLGLRVIPWTVNRRLSMRRLITWGVQGLITDRPDLAMAEISGLAGAKQARAEADAPRGAEAPGLQSVKL